MEKDISIETLFLFCSG